VELLTLKTGSTYIDFPLGFEGLKMTGEVKDMSSYNRNTFAREGNN
jgi:hypothetical protein